MAARTRLPRRAVDLTYASLYVGMEQSTVASPSLLVSTSLATIEKNFPRGSSTASSPPPRDTGPQLYLGLTLARYSCLTDHLAGITYGPGARLTLSVEKQRLLPGRACSQLIGPLMYQVVALPLSQFPAGLRLKVTLDRPTPL
ncbi:MAG TPA: hypothetical protein VMV09_09660, partial [Candidatus Saccharimonadales bacterium]|nr:hypothetical protein [Candidatus Saccharimonadales bacterium]